MGETVVIAIPSQELTLTASVAATARPTRSSSRTRTARRITLIMKKDGSVWKIDVAETERPSAAASRRQRGSGAARAP